MSLRQALYRPFCKQFFRIEKFKTTAKFAVAYIWCSINKLQSDCRVPEKLFICLINRGNQVAVRTTDVLDVFDFGEEMPLWPKKWHIPRKSAKRKTVQQGMNNRHLPYFHKKAYPSGSFTYLTLKKIYKIKADSCENFDKRLFMPVREETLISCSAIRLYVACVSCSCSWLMFSLLPLVM